VARINRDSVDRFFDQDIWLESRTIYIGANHTNLVNEEYGMDEISPATAERTIKGLAILDSQNQDRSIRIILNSPGGDIYQGLAIYDAIKRCQSQVEILATGQCMSAASIILQAADTRTLSPNCLVMVHDGEDGYSGHPSNLEAWAKISKQTSQLMYRIYSERSGKTPAYWAKKCKQDYILTAEEAIAEGLADNIEG
jgi:ATP-dependent Clp protease protease subunit